MARAGGGDGVDDGVLHAVGGRCAQGCQKCRVHACSIPGGQGEEGVTVHRRMRGTHRPRQPVVPGQCQAFGLRLGHGRVGGDHADGGVEVRGGVRHGSELVDVHRRPSRRPVEGAGCRVDDLPDRVRHDARGHHELPHRRGGLTETATQVTGGGPGAGADAAGDLTLAAGERMVHGGQPVLTGGTVGGITDQQVEDHRGGHDRDDRPRSVRSQHRETDSAFLQCVHHPVGGGQPIGRSTAQGHGMDLLHRVVGFEEISLPGARSPAADIHPGEGTTRCHHDGHTGVT
ncbi:putative hydrolase [Corynebacterium efficiens YS-314]|uniref:Putative hydrolase n=1 Tax=Corynebacterium efficiens (strain DSM 44549 / YS-314 / AJ 12310 / JCM 11189 / NBRC 100395) TaxID=196164 RepID=Q8FMU1_COREF|nr:putative hydrolase [Corynebacterium efficiens YS-314]